ncbi:hypothetical protein SCYAM73S_05212 [Streptomyces cyaneofuscatus]
MEAPLGASEHRERRLHPDDGEAAHRPCAGVRAGPVRQGRDLQGRVRRPVLRGLRGVQAPRRSARRRGRVRRPEALPHPQEAGGAPQGGELLLQAERVRPEAAGVLRGEPGLHPARVGPQRDRELRRAGPPGPVDLALHLRLGRPGPLGRQARHLRLDRRAPELRDGRGLRRQPGEVRRYVPGGRAPDRQGHPPLPHGDLARDADGAGPPASRQGRRQRLADGRRREDVQVQPDRHQAAGPDLALRRGRVPLVLPAGHRLRQRRLVLLGGLHRPLHLRAGQRLRQPRLARGGHGRQVLRRRAAGGHGRR